MIPLRKQAEIHENINQLLSFPLHPHWETQGKDNGGLTLSCCFPTGKPSWLIGNEISVGVFLLIGSIQLKGRLLHSK